MPTFSPITLMELWGRSSITSRCLEGLVRRGLLCPLSAVQECLIPSDEGELAMPEGYVVSFAIFMSRDLQYPHIDSFGDCWIIMRWSYSI